MKTKYAFSVMFDGDPADQREMTIEAVTLRAAWRELTTYIIDSRHEDDLVEGKFEVEFIAVRE